MEKSYKMQQIHFKGLKTALNDLKSLPTQQSKVRHSACAAGVAGDKPKQTTECHRGQIKKSEKDGE